MSAAPRPSVKPARERVKPAPPPFAFDLAMPRVPPAAAATDRIRSEAPAFLRINAPGHLYVPRLLHERGMRDYEVDTISCFLATIELVRPATVFDVGANVGVFAFTAAALTTAEVVAFEPTPELAIAARTILSDNELAAIVEEIALGDHEGTATLHLSDSTDSSNSLREGFRKSRAAIEVRLETLDGYCGRAGRQPGVMKIDTESTEPDVLRGASGLLARDRPWIICEVLAGRTEFALMEILRPLGYRWYPITDESPLPERAGIVGDRTYRFLNWLFVPEVPPSELWSARDAWRAALADCPPPVAAGTAVAATS